MGSPVYQDLLVLAESCGSWHFFSKVSSNPIEGTVGGGGSCNAS